MRSENLRSKPHLVFGIIQVYGMTNCVYKDKRFIHLLGKGNVSAVNTESIHSE